ncbi:MAG: LptE family protein [Crocinitomicaceae bacterium]
MKSLFIIFSFIAGIYLLNSCKVTYGFTDGTPACTECKTFSVSIFENSNPNAPVNYGQIFTEDLKDALLNRTKYQLVGNEGDLQFEGKVTGYNISPVSIQNDENAAQNRLTISISVIHKNALKDSLSFNQTFSRFADYPSDQDINSVQSALLEEINQQITQDILNKLNSNW